MNKTQIQILYFPDCPLYKELEKLVKDALVEAGIEAELEMVNIQTKEDAKKYHFTGSPGLLINGQDIDPLAKDAPIVFKSCKIYRTEEGMKMMPTKRMIQDAFKKIPVSVDKPIKGCCC